MFKQLQNDIHQKCILVRTLDCIEVGWLVGFHKASFPLVLLPS